MHPLKVFLAEFHIVLLTTVGNNKKRGKTIKRVNKKVYNNSIVLCGREALQILERSCKGIARAGGLLLQRSKERFSNQQLFLFTYLTSLVR